jgi:ribose/xylose/arabinose/galactoside ABC-type transport system permease subunit
MLRTLQKNNQLILLGILLLVWLVFGIINPQILTISNFYSLTRASIIPAIFVLAEMLMMALGGIDISYAMIAACSSYCTFYIWTQAGWSGNSVIPFFLIAILIAVILQMKLVFHRLGQPSLVHRHSGRSVRAQVVRAGIHQYGLYL